MDAEAVLDQLKTILVERLKFEHFALAIDEREDLAPHFQSLGTLVGYITSPIGPA